MRHRARWSRTTARVMRLGVGSLRHPATLGKLFRLWKFLRREQIDVLQVYFPESTYLGVPVGWLAGVRHLVRTRNNIGYWVTPWHRRAGRFLQPLCPRYRRQLRRVPAGSPPGRDAVSGSRRRGREWRRS